MNITSSKTKTFTAITSWDDGCVDDLKLAELLDKYELPGIFYLPSRWGKYCLSKGLTPLTYDQAQDIAEKYVIGSHGTNHALLTRIPLHQAKYEIEQSKIELEEMFKQPIHSFCYPRGYANPEIQLAVKKAGYKDARSTLVGYIDESENPYFTQTSVHVGCQRKEYGDTHWAVYAMNLLNKALKQDNAIFHVWGHSHEITKNKNWPDVDNLFRRIREALSS